MELRIFVFVIVAACLTSTTFAATKITDSRQLSAQSKETTTVDFVRLFVMRLIFGLASAMGYGEGLSNFLGGIFVPPGADDYGDDYNDFVPDLDVF